MRADDEQYQAWVEASDRYNTERLAYQDLLKRDGSGQEAAWNRTRNALAELNRITDSLN